MYNASCLPGPIILLIQFLAHTVGPYLREPVNSCTKLKENGKVARKASDTGKAPNEDVDLDNLTLAMVSKDIEMSIPVAEPMKIAAPIFADILIPPGVLPGAVIDVSVHGKIMKVKVPQGATPGSTIRIRVSPLGTSRLGTTM